MHLEDVVEVMEEKFDVGVGVHHQHQYALAPVHTIVDVREAVLAIDIIATGRIPTLTTTRSTTGTVDTLVAVPILGTIQEVSIA